MRKLNEINLYIEDKIKYYEDNRDYSDDYLSILGDTLQYDGIYSEDEIYRILESNLETKTDYSYFSDDAVAVFPVGEIEIQIETDLTKKEYEAIEDKIINFTKHDKGIISAFICTGMFVRVYSDFKEIGEQNEN